MDLQGKGRAGHAQRAGRGRSRNSASPDRGDDDEPPQDHAEAGEAGEVRSSAMWNDLYIGEGAPPCRAIGRSHGVEAAGRCRSVPTAAVARERDLLDPRFGLP
jgi:hypothetical protein